jgi:hypothetical protein
MHPAAKVSGALVTGTSTFSFFLAAGRILVATFSGKHEREIDDNDRAIS